MTTPKCPLCGETPEYILDEGDGHCEYAGCPKCGLYAAPSWGDWNCSPNEEDTWQRWRDLVSKFPLGESQSNIQIMLVFRILRMSYNYK